MKMDLDFLYLINQLINYIFSKYLYIIVYSILYIKVLLYICLFIRDCKLNLTVECIKLNKDNH